MVHVKFEMGSGNHCDRRRDYFNHRSSMQRITSRKIGRSEIKHIVRMSKQEVEEWETESERQRVQKEKSYREKHFTARIINV